MSDPFTGRVAFCAGTGRCGTTFLSQVAALEPDVAASHERERLGATFHMFCKWHGIAIDHEGFLRAKEDDIRRDLAAKVFSLECSALLSHSIEELHERFRAKFILLVRHPAETVASFAVRGWFVRTPVRSDPHLPPSFYCGEEARHFLGRNLPHGDEFTRWAKLSQIGRIAWFWAARNAAILDQFSRLPAERCRVVKLEELDFAKYRVIAEWLGWRSSLDAAAFDQLAQSRPNAGPNVPRRWPEWNATERAEYEAEVATVSRALGYSLSAEAESKPRINTDRHG